MKQWKVSSLLSPNSSKLCACMHVCLREIERVGERCI
jgi:hypothetical protein